MSFSDSFFRDFRPLFHVLDEPYGHGQPSAVSRRNGNSGPISFFDDPFFNNTRRLRSPAVEINEEGDHYVVEAELPGVKKEDIDVRIGDAGRSLTIEGKSFRKFGRGTSAGAEGGTEGANTPAPAAANAKEGAQGKFFLSIRFKSFEPVADLCFL